MVRGWLERGEREREGEREAVYHFVFMVIPQMAYTG
jgi:hypothetical protein